MPRAPSELTVAAAQMEGCGGSLDERLMKVEAFAKTAATKGARLLVLPEMSVDGYDLSFDMPAHATPGCITDALTGIARRADLYIVSGTTELAGADRFNVLTLVGPDGLVGLYRKLHVSTVENAFWRCGTGPAILECDLGRIGLGICADMLFPSPWSGYQAGVDLVAIGSAWPDHHFTRPFPYGRRFERTHAAATTAVPHHLSWALGVPVVHANAAGRFSARLPPIGLTLSGQFAGGSCIVDEAAGGARVDKRAEAKDELIVAEVQCVRRSPSVSLTPWIPAWPKRFRLAAHMGEAALGRVYQRFYRPVVF